MKTRNACYRTRLALVVFRSQLLKPRQKGERVDWFEPRCLAVEAIDLLSNSLDVRRDQWDTPHQRFQHREANTLG